MCLQCYVPHNPCYGCIGKLRMVAVQVLLVGGATRMPGVRQLVTNMTGLDPRVSKIDPDQVGCRRACALWLLA